jgi:hypothetical protein
MATGHEMQLTGHIGEHLVAAELGKRGYLATPFSGNVPLFDILAADGQGFAIPIQVKTIRGPSWQFSIDSFLDVEMVGDEQRIRGKKPIPNPYLLCIFVALRGSGDEFYILRLQDLQDHFFQNYKGGVRPSNPQSKHCAIWPSKLNQFRDNWQLVKTTFELAINAQSGAKQAA